MHTFSGQPIRNQVIITTQFIASSESSFFVYPYKLILKTCGTTLNLLGLPRILEIAQEECNLTSIIRCFYSRKSFMFPERQTGPHRDWKEEVQFLDNLYPGGAAYTVGKMNGDHWLLWLIDRTTTSLPPSPVDSPNAHHIPEELPVDVPLDYTLEILMSKLSLPSREHFFFPAVEGEEATAQTRAIELSEKLGISSIFPASLTKIDAYAFDPCGYSANAVITPHSRSQEGEGYWTIHVTPEEGWSYASFECNVPAPALVDSANDDRPEATPMPNLRQLIQRVVDIFQPGNLSVTLFVSNGPSVHNSPIETAQAVFRDALLPKGYKRTDKITYEFSGYDLAFASFKL